MYQQFHDINRPVTCLDSSSNKPLDVFPCAADATLITEDLNENKIIEMCNGKTFPSKYQWEWYDKNKHGSPTQILHDLFAEFSITQHHED